MIHIKTIEIQLKDVITDPEIFSKNLCIQTISCITRSNCKSNYSQTQKKYNRDDKSYVDLKYHSNSNLIW
jgi:hypothetical protein